MVAIVSVGLVALPTLLIFAVGMIPTLVSFVVDKTRRRAQTVSVGAISFAACMFYVLDLWGAGNDLDGAFTIVSNPMMIVVTFGAAAVGYGIDIVVSGMASHIMYANLKRRQSRIKKSQKDLVERWGREVRGDIPLDAHGVPIVAGAQDSEAQ